MADPVDTDALRDKATWLGHLDHEFGQQVAEVADEVDRLRAVIENAPHSPVCRWDRTDALAYRGQAANCTCWKAGAL